MSATAARRRSATASPRCWPPGLGRASASSTTTTPACRSQPGALHPGRVPGLKPGDADWPKPTAYNGDYIRDIAADYLRGDRCRDDRPRGTGKDDADDLDAIRSSRSPTCAASRTPTCAAFGVRSTTTTSRARCTPTARWRRPCASWSPPARPTRKDGALWLRTTDFGDDKDRVMRKSDGTTPTSCRTWPTTSASGSAATSVGQRAGRRPPRHRRARARRPAGAGLRHPAGYPDYVLHQMVTVMRGGEEVKISKRAGSYVTLRDLIDEAGRDAVRFFLVARKPDSQLTFDIDLARSQSNDNPVYYVQYAHARICSVLAAAEAGRVSPTCWRVPPPSCAARRGVLPARPGRRAARWYAAERFLVDDAALAAIAWRCWRPHGRCCATRSSCSASARPSTWCARRPLPRRPRHERRAGRVSALGGFVGLVVGLLLGLALALGVALYITKAPVPFVNKVPQRTAEQDRPRQSATALGSERPAGGQGAGPRPMAAPASAASEAATSAAAAASSPASASAAAARRPPERRGAMPPPRPRQPPSRGPHRRGLRLLRAGGAPTHVPKRPNSSAPGWRCSA
jgi:hypothetical protein